MNYKKDFDKWNSVKKKINDRRLEKLFYKEREIWWSSIGVNVGVEIDGKNESFERPVLILKKINKEQFLGLPITSKDKKGFLYTKIKYNDGLNEGSVNFAQIRIFSSKRLLRKMSMVSKEDFLKLKSKLLEFFE